jgi:hypothetical protein
MTPKDPRARILPAALASALLVAAAAAGASSGKAAPRAEAGASAGCAHMLDSLEVLHASDRPDYLAWDFGSLGCTRDQLYRAYARQGFGALLLSEWEEAAALLNLAWELGGPMDEEILYQRWTAYRKLGMREEMLEVARAFYARFPESPYMLQVLDEWKEARRPRSEGWKLSFDTRIARSSVPALDNDVSARLRGELGQALGAHSFRERVSLSFKSDAGRRTWEGMQLSLGAEYRRGGFGAEIEWGLGYDARYGEDTLPAALREAGSAFRESGWNGRIAQAAVSWTGHAGEGWGLGARLGARMLSSAWWSAGASLAPSWSAGDWSVSGLLDFQYHGLDWGLGQADSLEGAGTVAMRYALDGMQTFQAALSPARRLGRHDLSLGLGYSLVRYASELTFDFAGVAETERDAEMEHSLSLSPAWRMSLGRGLRFNLGASLGYDFGERGPEVATCREWLPGHCAEESYGLDAGFSVAF